MAIDDNATVPFELDVMAGARRYQEWTYRAVEPFMGRRILEIGSGIGNMSQWLPRRDRLILTESDAALFSGLTKAASTYFAGESCIDLRRFDLMQDDLSPLIAENLDTIVSFNVLEHIKDDLDALRRLKTILLTGSGSEKKRIITFVPAHQWAYGATDRKMGHFRRYSVSHWKQLQRSIAPEASLYLRHFNLPALAGWFLNSRLRQNEKIGADSINWFERLCPFIAPVDDFIHDVLKLPMGNSLVAVLEWK